MRQYKDLNLKAIMEAENLDFARWTYSKGQCSCCYGPEDMPAKYWRNGEKPIYHKQYIIKDGRQCHHEWKGEIYLHLPEYTYILFKNANNGSGTVTKNDIIKDYTCVAYRLKDMEQVKRICDLLQAQLDDDYIVICPKNDFHCIVIRTKEGIKLRP